MKRFALISALLAICSAASGCGIGKYYDYPVRGELTVIPHDSSGAGEIDPASRFVIGKIIDSSGFDPDNKTDFDLADAMKTSLQAVLSKHTPQGKAKLYSINVNILKYYIPSTGEHLASMASKALIYVPLLLATGSDYRALLSVHVEIADKTGKRCAIFNVHNAKSPAESIFYDVAEELISVLTNPTERVKIIRSESKRFSTPLMLPSQAP